ncbi:hypothetical protein ACOMHN_048934 [Nucella lapillus]
MDSPTRKIIVKNLPESWTCDSLLNYLEVTSGERLTIERDGIQVSLGASHSALLTLEGPVTAETLQHVAQQLTLAPFQTTNVLRLQMVPRQTRSLLVHYFDPTVSRDLIWYYFEEPLQSGCGDGYVEDCQMYPELSLAVVRFSSPEALEGVIARGNHCLKSDGEALRVEPWYEPFHGPLLQQATMQRRPCQNQTIPEQSSNQTVRKQSSHQTIPEQSSLQAESRGYRPYQNQAVPEQSSHQTIPEQSSLQAESRGYRPYQNQAVPEQSYLQAESRGYRPYQNQAVPEQSSPQAGSRGYRPYQNQAVPEQSSPQAGSRGYRQVLEDCVHPVYSTAAEGNPHVPSMPHPVRNGGSLKPHLYSPSASSAAAAASDMSRDEAQEFEKLRQENELLKKMLASREAKEYEEREKRQQERLRPEEEQIEQLLAEHEAEQRLMEEQRAKSVRVEREWMLQSEEGIFTETERVNTAQSDILRYQQLENERLKSENEKLKNQTSTSLPVPAYKFRLLESFAEQCTSCKLMFLEQKEELMFYGTEEDCEMEKLRVLKRLHDLATDTVPLSDPVAEILDSTRGRAYLRDLVQKHWGCEAEVQDRHLLCAALSKEELQDFVKELHRHILTETCLVPAQLIQSLQFQALTLKLEKDYMVVVTPPPRGNAEHVHLHGLKGDVEMAAWKVAGFTNLYRPGSKEFVIPGALQGNACRSWFSEQLDEVKLIIWRSDGEIEEETKEGEYKLRFQCCQEALADVNTRLEAIRSSIVTGTIDLNREFPEYSERALVVNGLYDVGVRAFCWSVGEKVAETGVQSIGDILLPDKYPLSSVSLAEAGDEDEEDSSDSPERPSKHSRRQRAPHGGRGRHKGARHLGGGSTKAKRGKKAPSHLPYSVSMGSRTKITVKLGDITAEQVCAAVSVLGPDLNPKTTAIGASFLSKWPFLSLVLVSSGGTERGEGDGCRVLTTPVTKSCLPMSTLLHAVLNKLQRPDDVSKTVKEVVLHILHLAAQKGIASIAFPPLGVGRRFGFGGFTTATAMISAFHEFLQTSPTTLENITVVVYKDANMADKFVQVMKRMWRGRRHTVPGSARFPLPVGTHSDRDHSDSDGDCDVSQDEDENGGGETGGKFEAVVCARNQADCETVKDLLLKELQTIFLWHETLSDAQTQALLTLPLLSLQELAQCAVERNVLLSVNRRKKGIRLRGQKDRVQDLLLQIVGKVQVGQPTHSPQERALRQKLHLPEDTDRLPDYWRVCRGNPNMPYAKAIESWKKRGLRLNSVSEEEETAVRQLVASTWVAKVGKGADAKNLKHSNIKVLRVERVENPKLWRRYSQRREQLFTNLLYHHTGQDPTTCTPVESLPKSSGQVQTTRRISQRSPLNRHVFRQVNEHYLFHGTKTDTLSKICSEGLDDRLTGKAMLGRGVYMTESSTKADQYADPKGSRVAAGQELKILLVRVLLGEPYLLAGDAEPFARPPCYFCKKKAHDCGCKEPRCYDSVVFDSSKIFREFVVYEGDVCYPEYVITYSRI